MESFLGADAVLAVNFSMGQNLVQQEMIAVNAAQKNATANAKHASGRRLCGAFSRLQLRSVWTV
jgi:hypothetical protein